MCIVFCTRFIKAASLQGLSQQDTTAASLCKAMSEDTHSDLIIDCSTSPPTVSNTGKVCSVTYTWLGTCALSSFLFLSLILMFSFLVSNRFCDDWIQAFLNAAERCNPFLLRQILENFKLKVTTYTHTDRLKTVSWPVFRSQDVYECRSFISRSASVILMVKWKSQEENCF